MTIDDEVYILDLRLNEELVAGDHVISYQKNGKTVLHKPTKEVSIRHLNFCIYNVYKSLEHRTNYIFLHDEYILKITFQVHIHHSTIIVIFYVISICQ